jgi:hypothetical protein
MNPHAPPLSGKEPIPVRFLLAIPALLLLFAFAACKSEEGEKRVDITLQEWSVNPGADKVKAGDVRFDLDNKGPDQAHQLVIIRTDFTPDKIPTKADGSVDEKAAGVNVIGKISDFDPGKKSSGTFTLSEGAYVLLCNLVSKVDGQDTSHYQQGMRIAFTATK